MRVSVPIIKILICINHIWYYSVVQQQPWSSNEFIHVCPGSAVFWCLGDYFTFSKRKPSSIFYKPQGTSDVRIKRIILSLAILNFWNHTNLIIIFFIYSNNRWQFALWVIKRIGNSKFFRKCFIFQKSQEGDQISLASISELENVNEFLLEKEKPEKEKKEWADLQWQHPEKK